MKITSIFIKPIYQGQNYGTILMIFYLCSLIQFIHNSYLIKYIYLEDTAKDIGKGSFYDQFKYNRINDDEIMALHFLRRKSKKAYTSIIEYYNELLDLFKDKLNSFITDTDKKLFLIDITNESNIEFK